MVCEGEGMVCEGDGMSYESDGKVQKGYDVMVRENYGIVRKGEGEGVCEGV